MKTMNELAERAYAFTQDRRSKRSQYADASA